MSDERSIVSFDGNCFVYVLRCVGNRYYVGYSNDVFRRLHKQRRGCGAQFVRRFGFEDVEFVLCVCSLSDVGWCDKVRFIEKLLAEVYRVRYGFDNVAGYCWSQGGAHLLEQSRR